MRVNLTWVRLVSCTLLSAASISLANAATYDYTGNLFTSATGPYTTGDSVAGSMTFTSPLADNLSSSPVTPNTFLFSDGVQTVMQGTSSGSSFSVSTNALGEISGWNIVLFSNTCLFANSCVVQTNTNSPNAQDIGEIALAGGFIAFGSVTNNPGTWTTPVTPTPLPAALPLFAGGLGVMGLLGWRKKRKTVPA